MGLFGMNFIFSGQQGNNDGYATPNHHQQAIHIVTPQAGPVQHQVHYQPLFGFHQIQNGGNVTPVHGNMIQHNMHVIEFEDQENNNQNNEDVFVIHNGHYHESPIARLRKKAKKRALYEEIMHKENHFGNDAFDPDDDIVA